LSRPSRLIQGLAGSRVCASRRQHLGGAGPRAAPAQSGHDFAPRVGLSAAESGQEHPLASDRARDSFRLRTVIEVGERFGDQPQLRPGLVLAATSIGLLTPALLLCQERRHGTRADPGFRSGRLVAAPLSTIATAKCGSTTRRRALSVLSVPSPGGGIAAGCHHWQWRTLVPDRRDPGTDVRFAGVIRQPALSGAQLHGRSRQKSRRRDRAPERRLRKP
jgi:hypothetical protein